MKKYISVFLTIIILTFLTACQSNAQKQNTSESKYTATEKEVVTVNGDSNASDNQSNQKVTDCNIEINNVGDTVNLGEYEQDNNTSNGKEEIEWICIKKEDNKALLISKYCLDGQPYNIDFVEINWGNCSLRNWLNSAFYEEAFSDSEQSKILTTEILNSGEENTIDMVSLLSVEEVNEYFNSTDERIASLTDYAAVEIERNATSRFSEGYAGGWWLRSMGEKFQDSAAHVGENGYVFSSLGANVDLSQGVRPIIWVNLE